MVQEILHTQELPLKQCASMPRKGPKGHSPEAQAFLKLAKELRTETSTEGILNHLKQLNTARLDELTATTGLRLFLREDGLSTVIRLLRGTATPGCTPDADSLQSAISEQAGQVLTAVHRQDWIHRAWCCQRHRSAIA